MALLLNEIVHVGPPIRTLTSTAPTHRVSVVYVREMSLRTWVGALEDRNFRLFFIGQTASQIGNGMAPVAIVFAVLSHGTASDVGYVLAAQTIPLVMLLLAGGVVGDRVNRRTLMLRSDVLRTIAECALGIWILRGSPPLWGFIVLGALLGIGEAFFNPALTGIVPQLLTPEKLQQGNAQWHLRGEWSRCRPGDRRHHRGGVGTWMGGVA